MLCAPAALRARFGRRAISASQQRVTNGANVSGCGIRHPWRHTEVVRITIRVRPGSASPGVGGEHDGALVVRVSARAADGKATTAALTAVAAAVRVPPRALH